MQASEAQSAADILNMSPADRESYRARVGDKQYVAELRAQLKGKTVLLGPAQR